MAQSANEWNHTKLTPELKGFLGLKAMDFEIYKYSPVGVSASLKRKVMKTGEPVFL